MPQKNNKKDQQQQPVDHFILCSVRDGHAAPTCLPDTQESPLSRMHYPSALLSSHSEFYVFIRFHSISVYLYMSFFIFVSWKIIQ